MQSAREDMDLTVVPRWAVSLPLPVDPPQGFVADDPRTWPTTAGRFEFAAGKLWYMPPCGDEQQQTVADVVGVLSRWRAVHPQFRLGTNEAGMLLGGEVRGADAAIWRVSDLGPATGGFPRVPPVLAVEVAGRDDTLTELRSKARWYLGHGVEVVWLVDPGSRSVAVLDSAGETTVSGAERIPERLALPDLDVRADQLFVQIGNPPAG